MFCLRSGAAAGCLCSRARLERRGGEQDEQEGQQPQAHGRIITSTGDRILFEVRDGDRRIQFLGRSGFSLSASCRYASSSRGNATGYTPV